MKLINKTNGKVLVENFEVADTPAKRMKGLLGRETMASGEGLHIIPCNNIHSFFMKFKFDAVFIDKKNKVRCIVENMSPARIKFCFWAHSVIELPAGVIADTGTMPGDEIGFVK